ncbi:MAG: CRISPR-associated endonuclease Cas1 [Chloroflexota bacterium]
MPNLYVTEPGATVTREYERIVVIKSGEVLLDVPAIKVENVVLVGNVGVTTPALGQLLDRGIGLVLLSSHGELRGRLSADRSVNTALRRAQYERSRDPAFRLSFARSCVAAKLHNSRAFCLRWARDGVDVAADSAARLAELEASLEQAGTEPLVRAVEAQGARAYFRAFRGKLRPGWEFPSRRRRPPPDPVNALLGATYTLLGEAIYSAVVLAGLDPYCGFYHAERPGRPALVLDLLEEMRALIADSVTLLLINKRVLAPDDFRPGPPERPIILEPSGYRKVLSQFNARLRTGVQPPGTAGRQTTYQRIFELQARRLAATIGGRSTSYQAFRTR